MSLILAIILFVIVVFVALAIGGGLLALLAYGTGWLLNHLMGFDPFQATLIALLSICVFGLLAERLFQAILSTPSFMSRNTEDDDEEYDDEDEEEYEDDEDEEEEEPVIVFNPRIPRWRQPLKTPDFSQAKPDDRCPCGSGRKFKNCHGSKNPK
jgi:hypothetical protein